MFNRKNSKGYDGIQVADRWHIRYRSAKCTSVPLQATVVRVCDALLTLVIEILVLVDLEKVIDVILLIFERELKPKLNRVRITSYIFSG